MLPMHTRARFQQGDAPRSPFYESFAHLLCAAPSTLRWKKLSAPWKFKLDGSMPTPFDGSLALARDVPRSI